MELFYQIYPETYSPLNDERSPIVIIPGLFGSSVNWRSFAKQLGSYHPVVVVDQRNHGNSPHADSNTYLDMASDVLELIDHFNIDKVNLCGHSMGGKVAMVFSLLYPERVSSLAVLDIAPVEYKHTHAPFLERMMAIDLDSLVSRSDAGKQLSQAIPDTSTRMFLLQSLAGTRGDFHWKLNLSVLLDYMPVIKSFPFSELDGLSNEIETLFISGAQSDFVLSSQHSQIFKFFPSAEFTAIANAGHWLHAEAPQAVLSALLNFLQLDKKND